MTEEDKRLLRDLNKTDGERLITYFEEQKKAQKRSGRVALVLTVVSVLCSLVAAVASVIALLQ